MLYNYNFTKTFDYIKLSNFIKSKNPLTNKLIDLIRYNILLALLYKLIFLIFFYFLFLILFYVQSAVVQ